MVRWASPSKESDYKASMRKKLAAFVTALLCSITISFVLVDYLLNEWTLIAIFLIALCVMGGFWLPKGEAGTKRHVSWVGASIGLYGAVVLFLPSILSMQK